MAQRKIYFFADGVTVVSDPPGEYGESAKPWPALFDGSHSGIQVPWIAVFADFMRSKGLNPDHFELVFPDGRTGWIFWNDDPDCYDPPGNWSWKIIDPPPPASGGRR